MHVAFSAYRDQNGVVTVLNGRLGKYKKGDVIPPEVYAQTVKAMYAVSASQAAGLPRRQGKLAELALGYQGGDVRRET